MIYFLQDPVTCDIKIGFTDGDDALGRVDSLQTGNSRPLVLLATRDGTKADEAALHKRFAAARGIGEWFRPVPALVEYLLTEAHEGAYRLGFRDGSESECSDVESYRRYQMTTAYLAFALENGEDHMWHVAATG